RRRDRERMRRPAHHPRGRRTEPRRLHLQRDPRLRIDVESGPARARPRLHHVQRGDDRGSHSEGPRPRRDDFRTFHRQGVAVWLRKSISMPTWERATDGGLLATTPISCPSSAGPTSRASITVPTRTSYEPWFVWPR